MFFQPDVANPASGNLNKTDMKKYILLLLILAASCQKEEGQTDEGTRAIDTTAVDSLPDGCIRIFIDTDWDGETHISF